MAGTVIKVPGMSFDPGPAGIGTPPQAGEALLLGIGTAGTPAAPRGVLHVNTTAAANAANTSEQVLWTYTLPANTLSANGLGVRVEVMAQAAANANDKAFRLYFGAAMAPAIAGMTVNNTPVRLHMTVVRTAAGAQLVYGMGEVYNSHVWNLAAAGTETLAGDVAIQFRGQSPTTGAANDVTFKYAIVEAF